MSTRNSRVYKSVKEHYPISKEHCGAREHQVENPVPETPASCPIISPTPGRVVLTIFQICTNSKPMCSTCRFYYSIISSMIANFARLRYTIYVWTKSNLTILEQGCQAQVQVWSAEKNSRNNKKNS
jgi:hypothetical protein